MSIQTAQLEVLAVQKETVGREACFPKADPRFLLAARPQSARLYFRPRSGDICSVILALGGAVEALCLAMPASVQALADEVIE